jgi:predicted Zn-dependent protease
MIDPLSQEFHTGEAMTLQAVIAESARRWAAVLLALALVVSVPATPAHAQRVSIIRDAEVEQLLRDYADPIFRVAGVNKGAVKIILVGDRSFNAFVASGRKVFMNLGVIMDSTTPNQVIGVLAHETGHIAGGHLVRFREQLERAQIMAVAGMLLGAGAVFGGARSGQVGMSGNAPMGVIMGPAEMVRRSLLAYQRSEEAAADRAAVNYLNATGQSARGMLETFERFSADTLFRREGADPFLQSHPMAPERISALQELATRSPHFNKRDSAALQRRHEMARAKLWGFMARADELARRYAPNDMSLPARYARAISAYRFQSGAAAQSQIDGLIREQPNNPYFWELKGQALLESGKAREAIQPLRRAVALAPNQPLLRGILGHALVASGDARLLDEAIRELNAATQRDPDAADAFQVLARAHAAKGDEPRASLAAAQGFFIAGQYEEARRLARRAMAGLRVGTPGWLKADEIFNYRPPAAG